MKSTLKFKLMMAFILIGVSATLVVGLTAYYKSSASLENYAFAQLTSVRDVMKTQLENYLEKAHQDVTLLADSNTVKNLYLSLKTYQKLEEMASTDRFHTDTYEYNTLWQTEGATLKNYVSVYGYSDVFLISADTGHIMYSAQKNADLGMNLAKNEDKTNPVTDIWQRVLDSKTVQYEDFTPYQSQNNIPSAFIAAPVFNLKQQVVAVVVLQLSNRIINDIMGQRSGMGETGESYLVGQDHLMRSDSFLDKERFSIINAFKANNKAQSDNISKALAGETGTEIVSNYLGYDALSAYTPIRFGDTSWAVISEIDEDEAFQAVSSMKYMILIIGLIITAIIVFIAIYLSSSITAPVKKMTEFLDELAKGHIGNRTQLVRDDEIGHMAKALDNLAIFLEDQLVRGLQNISQGNLSQKITPQDGQDVISHALSQTNQDLTNIVNEISGYTDNLVEESNKVLTTSNQMSSSSVHSEQALESISASLIEVGQVSDITADKTDKADQLGAAAAKSASAGREQVQDAVAAMNDIREAGNNISSILTAIENIADQTNLLALNAAIEAARAGEAGRGFAVVADEVRTLAAQSTKAASETAELIKVVVDKTAIGSNITMESAESLTDIVEAVEGVSSLMGDIARASKEQSLAMSEANENLIKIADVNRETSKNAQQGVEVSHALSSFSNGLKEIVAKFTLR